MKRFFLGYLHIIDTLVNDFPSPFRIWIGNVANIGVYDALHIKVK